MAIYKDVEPLEVFAYNSESEEFDEGVKFALEKLDELPEADVVEVVRCKDCDHLEKYGFCFKNINGLSGYKKPKADDFCSYGRRKDEISKATDS